MKITIKLPSIIVVFFSLTILFCKAYAQSASLSTPIVDSEIFYEEKEGFVAVEAEHFYKQSKSDLRKWYITSINKKASVGRDEDPEHSQGASNNAYIEVLPDERVTHADKLEQGVNFTDNAGLMAVVHYKVKINKPGRYYVWVKAFNTGSEDNGIHVGFNGTWPENGKRMQWCEDKNKWTWASKQRTKEVHCGVPKLIYLDIEKAGIQDVQFSMREDGFEFDKFILTSDIDYIPDVTDNKASILTTTKPPVSLENETKESSYFTKIANANAKNKYIAAQQFSIENTKFYKDGKRWLAINPKVNTEATTSTTFNFESGRYDIVFVAVGENDGSSSFKININDKELGSHLPPMSTSLFEEGKTYNAFYQNVRLKKGDKISITAKIGSADGKEHTRGRWAGLVFAPVGKGKEIQEAPSSFTSK